MFEGQIKIKNKKIPRTLLGTSPFIGAGQFGHRARLYQLDLYNQPENMLKIIRKSYKLGVKGIQLIPYPPVVDALNWAREEGCKLNIVGTLLPGREKEDIEILSQLDADAMLLHGSITDSCDWKTIEGHLQLIMDKDCIPGLATHTPFRTTERLLNSSILDLFDIYMVPMNKLGYLMDTEVFMDKERTELGDMLKKMDKTIIAKKTLAAGILTPDDAFDYIKTVDYADLITVGIASEAEAEETFSLLADK